MILENENYDKSNYDINVHLNDEKTLCIEYSTTLDHNKLEKGEKIVNIFAEKIFNAFNKKYGNRLTLTEVSKKSIYKPKNSNRNFAHRRYYKFNFIND